MKTKENFKRNSLKSKKLVTILMSIVLINLSSLYSEVISAENRNDKLEDTNQINMESLIKEDSEEELKLESWMTNEFLSNETVTSDQSELYFDEAIEENLEIEPWMLEFNLSNYAASLCVPDKEEELEIEEWMLHINSFQEKDNMAKGVALK